MQTAVIMLNVSAAVSAPHAGAVPKNYSPHVKVVMFLVLKDSLTVITTGVMVLLNVSCHLLIKERKMKNFIRFTSLCGIVLLFPTGNTAAQTSGQCAIAPTCSELGYEQKATDCSGQYMLKCPFDNSKVFCGGIDCSYTNTSLPSGCSNAPSCTKDGKNYFSAVCSSCYTGYSLKSDGTCSQTCTYSDSSLTGCADIVAVSGGLPTGYTLTINVRHVALDIT